MLDVTPAVEDTVDVDPLLGHQVQDAVGFEEHLTIFQHPNLPELRHHTPPAGKHFELENRLFDALEDVVRGFPRVVPLDVIRDFRYVGFPRPR